MKLTPGRDYLKRTADQIAPLVAAGRVIIRSQDCAYHAFCPRPLSPYPGSTEQACVHGVHCSGM
jgi:hypothetical protein